MATLQKYVQFFASALLMCVVVVIIYPYYQYYVDPDGTAYLTISQRYANGDYAKAVNGYWSPWSCWLTAMFIKAGLAPIPASVVVNTLGATGFIFICQSLFLKFNMVRRTQRLLCITLAFFLCYAIFWQSFDDIWECFFLLSTLRIMLADQFTSRPFLWLFCGAIGALAYFAKAYSFPFFILNTFCCTYLISKGNTKTWLKISITMVSVMMLCSLPWIYALHSKYDIWTTSTAGTLNTSWYLVGHPYWKEGIDQLVPPAYHDSPYYWEDPYFANGVTPHFWNSLSLFGLQILRVGYNLYKFLISTIQLSVFFPLMVGMALFSFRSKRAKSLFNEQEKVIMLSFLIFPLGYLLINFEPRYIWYMVPLGMVIGVSFFQRNSFRLKFPSALYALVFAFSFLIVPIWGLARMYLIGGREYQIAEQLKIANIHGSFTGNGHARVMSKIAWFSGTQYYFLRTDDYINNQALLNEMSRDKVKYFIYLSEPHSFGQTLTFTNFELHDENGKAFPDITNGQISGIKVFLVNP